MVRGIPPFKHGAPKELEGMYRALQQDFLEYKKYAKRDRLKLLTEMNQMRALAKAQGINID